MKNMFLKIAKVKDEGGFYKKYPTEQSFYEAHPEFMSMMRFRNGGMPTKRYSMYREGGPFDESVYEDLTNPQNTAVNLNDATNDFTGIDMSTGAKSAQTTSNTGSTQSNITPSAAPTGQAAPPKASSDKPEDKNFFTKVGSTIGKGLDMQTRNPAALVGNLGNAYLSLGALGSSKNANSYEKAQQRVNQLANSSINTIPEANTINPVGYYENGGSYRKYSLSGMSKGGGIHINPKNRGKFTESAHRAGYSSVQEYASHVLANKSKYSPLLVKRANFAKNAKLFKHEDGGQVTESSDVLDFVKSQMDKGVDPQSIYTLLTKKYKVSEEMAKQAIMHEIQMKEQESEDVGQDGQEYQDEDIQGVPDQDGDLNQAGYGGPSNMYTNPYGNPYSNPYGNPYRQPQQHTSGGGNSAMWNAAGNAAGKIGAEFVKHPENVNTLFNNVSNWMGKTPLNTGVDAATNAAANTATEAATNAATSAGSTVGTTAADAAATAGQAALTAGQAAGTALAGGADAAAAAAQGLAAAGEGIAAAGQAATTLGSLAVVRNGGKPKKYSLNIYTGNTDPRAKRVINKATKMDNGGLYEGQEIDLDPYTLSYLKSIGYEFE